MQHDREHHQVHHGLEKHRSAVGMVGAGLAYRVSDGTTTSVTKEVELAIGGDDFPDVPPPWCYFAI